MKSILDHYTWAPRFSHLIHNGFVVLLERVFFQLSCSILTNLKEIVVLSLYFLGKRASINRSSSFFSLGRTTERRWSIFLLWWRRSSSSMRVHWQNIESNNWFVSDEEQLNSFCCGDSNSRYSSDFVIVFIHHRCISSIAPIAIIYQILFHRWPVNEGQAKLCGSTDVENWNPHDRWLGKTGTNKCHQRGYDRLLSTMKDRDKESHSIRSPS